MKKRFPAVIGIVSAVILLLLAYKFVLSIQMGQHVSMPLIGCILLIIVGIYRIASIRKRFQGSDEEQKKFNKIVLRSVILAPIIVAAFLTVVVWVKLKMK